MQTEFLSQIQLSRRFAIYGAQVVAYGVYVALRSLYNIIPECFIVSNAKGNLPEIDGIPIRALDNCGLGKETLILVATTELLQDEICDMLQNCGFSNYLRFGARKEHFLMNAYFESIGKFPLLKGSASGTICDLALYEVKNHRDKPLANKPVLKTWFRPIQAGAEITNERVAPFLDNTGCNISAKNKMYSEMTATYWVWKNTSHDWKGICHYRRHLLISDAQLAMLADGSVDAILPLPYICFPNTLAQFRRFVSEEVKNALLSSLQALHPAQYDSYLSILNGQYQYTYNLVAARREVFDAYCSWVFAVLEHIERSSDKLPEIATTRALSYVAEVLTSLYFLFNSVELNIRHIEKRIFV
jgi:hypothetical protein